ncbi:Ig-like domain-containing protein [Tenacibaculum larymnensis]|uniref:Ig-like domain-containing protein n=1 Tax=Tenacibaculum larymnensis TaxID=2878201 RepID=A0A9X4ERQ5_9FLAO|nr:Ig-like domain-containing protein [Tenacibaculum larymnensis]MDE1205342.1 Ig-like domain-containing protein [Tenacibaculum larymnensis]
MKNKHFILVTLFAFLISSCARKGRPEGGPKDETAPIMVTANPPYETIHFDDDNIRIYFDEYIVLKDLQKQLVVSPPMKNPPLITPQGTPSKYINIKILDTLQPNTTYTFNFGNAVQDNNENNKLESFKYVFSTGDYIDSLRIKGAVADAFDKKEVKEVSVLLYKLDSTYNDSIIFKQKPNYVTSTLDSTNFEFSNLREGKYLMLALKEPSNDYIFNSRTDKIGFVVDTITLPQDTLISKPVRFFKEIQTYEFKRGKEVTKGKIQFGFEGRQKNMNIELLSEVPQDFKSFTQFEKDKDTLNYWYTPIERDSLNFIVNNENFKDTVTVFLRKKKIDSLSVSSSVSGNLNLKDTMFIKTNNPIVSFDKSKFSLIDKDTVDVPFELKKKSINKIAVLFEKKPKYGYIFKGLPEGITDIYETTNDTLDYKFSTRTVEDYGSIVLDVKKETESPVIIELLSQDKVLEKRYITSSKKIEFTLLEPKEYSVRAIVDENNNRMWDTGDFLLRKQPEKIIYYGTIFKLRANWVVENETFVIK